MRYGAGRDTVRGMSKQGEPSQVDGSEPTPDGRTLRWAGHNRQRRAELVDAALQAIRSHGHGVGLETIARVAGTRKPAIYRHFGDRVGLYSAVTAHVSMRLERRLRHAAAPGAEPRDVVASLTDAFFSLAEKDPEVYRFVVSPPQVSSSVAEQQVRGIAQRVTELVTEILGPHLDGDDERVRVWSIAVVGAVQVTAEVWLDEPRRRPRHTVVQDLAAILWHGLAGSLR